MASTISVTASSMVKLNAAQHHRHNRAKALLLASSSSYSVSFTSSTKLSLSNSRFSKTRPRTLPLGRRRGQLEVASLLVEFHTPPDVNQLNGLPSQVSNNSVEAKKQTFSSFDDLLKNSDKPVLVDFYATWCGPCQFMVPVLDQVGESMKDQIQIVKIDTEKYTAIADKYNIQALPTFIMFKDGEPCDRFEGAMAADKLIKRIEAALEVKQ